MGYVRVKNLNNGNITEIPEGFLSLPNYQNSYELTDEHEECATCKMNEPEVEAEENVGELDPVTVPFEAPTEPAETQTRKSRRKV